MYHSFKMLQCILLFVISMPLSAQLGLNYYDTTEAYNGYTLFAINSTVYLIDNCGKIINEWETGDAPRLSYYLMENGNLLYMSRLTGNSTFLAGGGGGGRLQMYSPDNNLIWQYDYYAPNQYCIHHDVEVLPNGNILALVWEEIPLAEAISEGRNPALLSNRMWDEKIIEIQPVGFNQADIVWEWKVRDHIIQDFDASRNNYGSVADHPELLDFNFNGVFFQADWLHLNSIDYNESLDQILISSRHLCEIYIIDHSTTTAEAAGHTGGQYNRGGDFLYRYGNPQAYRRGAASQQVLFSQHDAQWIPNGYPNEGKITLFNNGYLRGENNNYSSAEIIDVPVNANGNYTAPTNNQAFLPLTPSQTYSQFLNKTVYSYVQGGVQALPNGNLLVCTAVYSEYYEINTTTGETVWYYKSQVSGWTNKIQRYIYNYPGLQYFNLTPGNTVESPPSSVSNNCAIDYCTPFISQLNQPAISTGVYQTSDFIMSNGSINNNTTVNFSAANRIQLLNGFKVTAGATFSARIQYCD